MSIQKTRKSAAQRQALRKRAMQALDKLDVILDCEPVAGRCMSKFRKLEYEPKDIIEVYSPAYPLETMYDVLVKRGAHWRDDRAYYHVCYEDKAVYHARYKLFSSLEALCTWAELEVQAIALLDEAQHVEMEAEQYV